jgi:3-phosphoshikimate 1-carboxyvinyltransferase
VGGTVGVPGDKSISHRAVLLGAVANGTTTISGFLHSEDCLATLAALRAMGVGIEETGSSLTVAGVGATGLGKPTESLDLGNSGTAIRLLMGLLAAQPFDSVLTGDRSLRQRPMERVAEPLRAMGAQVTTDHGLAPVHIRGARPLRGIDYTLPVASAQLKSAILLAGLWGNGQTTVRSPGPSRDHTERMLLTMGVPLRRDTTATVSVTGPATLTGTSIDIPGDFSSAAFFIVAGLLGAADGLLLPAIGLNPTRTGLLTILRSMGGKIELRNERQSGAEPVADIYVERSELRGVEIGAELVALSIDELPILFIAAAGAIGTTVVTGAEELRHKESDRLAVMAMGLRALGATVDEQPDGLSIVGGALQGGRVDSSGDHRIAMAFAVASLQAQSTIEILDTSAVATSFPDFLTIAAQSGLRLEAVTAGSDE